MNRYRCCQILDVWALKTLSLLGESIGSSDPEWSCAFKDSVSAPSRRRRCALLRSIARTSTRVRARRPARRTGVYRVATAGLRWLIFPGGSNALTRVFVSGRGDLNPRPPAPKAGALPSCATSRCGCSSMTDRTSSFDPVRPRSIRCPSDRVRSVPASHHGLEPVAGRTGPIASRRCRLCGWPCSISGVAPST